MTIPDKLRNSNQDSQRVTWSPGLGPVLDSIRNSCSVSYVYWSHHCQSLLWLNNPPPCKRPLDPSLSTEGLVELDKVITYSNLNTLTNKLVCIADSNTHIADSNTHRFVLLLSSFITCHHLGLRWVLQEWSSAWGKVRRTDLKNISFEPDIEWLIFLGPIKKFLFFHNVK